MSGCCQSVVVESLDLVTLFGTGLAMSVGHCIGMCGPLVGAYALAQRGKGLAGGRLLGSMLVYHGGRVSSYAVLGAALGGLGSAAALAADARHWQAGLALLAGAVMLALGLGLIGALPIRSWINSSKLACAVIARAGGLQGGTSWPRRLALGVANGFLPCGPVYAVAIAAAAAGSAPRGALAMAAFGLGTVPVLIALGLGSQGLGATLRRRLYLAGAILVLFMALQLILRGLAALALVPHLRFGEVVIW